MYIKLKRPRPKRRGYTCFSCVHCLREAVGHEYYCKRQERFMKHRRPCKQYEKKE